MSSANAPLRENVAHGCQVDIGRWGGAYRSCRRNRVGTSGDKLHLIDRRAEPVHWSQAILIKSRTLEILDSLRLHDRFHDIGQIVRRVRIHWNELNTASFEFAGLDTPYPYILSIPEDETIRILTEKLASLAGGIERGVELVSLEQAEGIVRARLNSPSRGEYQLDASVVVGTDGFQSAVRHAIADPFEGAGYPELWGVFDTGLVNWSHERDTLCPQLAAPIAIPFALGK